VGRILLAIDQAENRRLLAEVLAPRHSVIEGSSPRHLAQDFDLIVVGGPVLQRLSRALLLTKRGRAPIFLPVLLLTSYAETSLASGDLPEAVDDVITLPVRKAEIKARIDLLLRTRRLSQQVKRHSDDLQALVHGLSHDLRAPARAATSFARLLREEYAGVVDETALHYLTRVEDATGRIQDVLEFLQTFAALGHSQVHRYPVPLDDAVALMIERFADQIVESGAVVRVTGALPEVLADPVLLDMVLSNLISNALKYVEPGTAPRVDLEGELSETEVRLHVQDQGIGIAAEAQARIWQPFVRLHGEEAYPGTGLGLAIAHRAAELMGCELGLLSEPGKGSRFWLRLPLAEATKGG
jgi:signal transduction histidine kinase